MPFLSSTEQAQRIRHLIEIDGLQQERVASSLGVHVTTLRRYLKANDIKTQRTGPRSGERHPDWRGGRSIDADGYVLLYRPGHPYARKRGASPPAYVAEHRLVMEAHLGRYLLPGEVVHHKNGKNDDNRLENLELFESNAAHLRHELTGRCPKWTEAGKARLRAAAEKARQKSRQRQAPGECQPQQTSSH